MGGVVVVVEPLPHEEEEDLQFEELQDTHKHTQTHVRVHGLWEENGENGD